MTTWLDSDILEVNAAGIVITNAAAQLVKEFQVRPGRLGLEIAVASHDLVALDIYGRFHKDGSLVLMYTAAGDYTNPRGPLIGTSGDLTIIAAAASGWLIMDVDGLASVAIKAQSGNAAGSVVSLLGFIGRRAS